jgi:cytochrome P450
MKSAQNGAAKGNALRIAAHIWDRCLFRFRIAMFTLRARQKSALLPPGEILRLDEMERSDRQALLKLAKVHGTVFKGTIDGRFAVCILGNKLARRLLGDFRSALKPVTIDVSRLFPGEFMRGMGGTTHKHYRAILTRGLSDTDLGKFEPSMLQMIKGHLEDYADSPTDPRQRFDDARRWAATLSEITSSMLIQVVLGAEPGSKLSRDLLGVYRDLGPNGVAWNVGDRQVAAYQDLRQRLRQTLTDAPVNGLIGMIASQEQGQGQIEETMLGNLIYMVETGRYDMRGLFRWISKYAAENPDWVERIASAPPQQSRTIAEAFVQEVLRLDQSERLMREVLEDIVFEGHFIPKGTLLRVCMWEAHKAEETFDDPFEFRPKRFLNEQAFGEKFSPFGLDQHHCPFSVFSIKLASLFLTELASGFEVSAEGGDPAVRGPYHWEPSLDFSVSLSRVKKA